MAHDAPPTPRHTYREKVLHAFVVDGRLTSIPARQRKRRIILEWIATTDFEPGREYLERDVDMRLALRHRDVAALRRSLVDDRYMSRSGGTYRLRSVSDWPLDPDADAPSEAGPRPSE